MADQFIQGQAGQGDGAAWSLEIARCKAVINRLDRRLGQATEAHAQARSALHNADQKHARAAIAILADEAEGLANDLANCEARSPMLCCSLDVLSRLWLRRCLPRCQPKPRPRHERQRHGPAPCHVTAKRRARDREALSQAKET